MPIAYKRGFKDGYERGMSGDTHVPPNPYTKGGYQKNQWDRGFPDGIQCGKEQREHNQMKQIRHQGMVAGFAAGLEGNHCPYNENPFEDGSNEQKQWAEGLEDGFDWGNDAYNKKDEHEKQRAEWNEKNVEQKLEMLYWLVAGLK